MDLNIETFLDMLAKYNRNIWPLQIVSFKFKSDPYSILGSIFILYGLAGYQVFGYFIGHRYPAFFAPGLVPYPTNVFTVGILLLTDKRFPKYLLIIPFLWSISGFIPVSKGILEDNGMMIFGVSGVVLIALRNRKAAAA